MSLALVGVAVLVGAGGIAATSARDVRFVLIGAMVALTLAPLVADPVLGPAALAVRVVAALLVAVLVRVLVLPDAAPASAGTVAPGPWSPHGWPAQACLALAAATVGAAIVHGMPPFAAGAEGGAGLGRSPDAAMVIAGAGAALVAAGLAPAVAARSIGRMTVGFLVLTQGVMLVRSAIAAPPGELEHVAIVIVLVAIAAGGGALSDAQRRHVAAVQRTRPHDETSVLPGTAPWGGRPGMDEPHPEAARVSAGR